MPPATDFKRETLEATYEEVNRIIKTGSGAGHDRLKAFIESGRPLNVFEKKVKSIFIDSCKVKEEVINGLLSNDPHIIHRLLKCNWFFEDAVSPEFYEENVFPKVSFSTRCKIINKLSRNIKSEQHAEQLFEFIVNKYDSIYSEMLLPKCGEAFISGYILENKQSLHNNNHSPKILINICKRYPNIVITFLEKVFHDEYPYKEDKPKYSRVIRYIARNHPTLFVTFFEKHFSELTFFYFGKKLTKTFALQLKNVIMNSKEHMTSHIINKSVFFKCLDFNDQITFLQVLVSAIHPELKLSEWSHALPNILPFVKLKAPNERVHLLESTFSKIYRQNFGDNPKAWSLDLLEMLPVKNRTYYVEELHKLSDEHIMDLNLHGNSEDSEREVRDVFWYLLSCQSAMPKLMELMPKMSTVERREALLKEMIRNCVINKDADGLASCLSYMFKKHKNDDPQMLARILNSFCSLNPKMFNITTWELIEQMANLSLLNHSNYFVYQKLIEKYIVFRLLNNLNVDAQVKTMVKMNFMANPHCCDLISNVREPMNKEILKLYYREICHMISTGKITEADRRKLLVCLLQSVQIINFNTKKDPIKIDEFPLLFEEIKWGMNLPDSSAVLHQLMSFPSLWEIYVDRIAESYFCAQVFTNFLKFRPALLALKFQTFGKNLLGYVGDVFTGRKVISLKCRLEFAGLTSQLREIMQKEFLTSTNKSTKLSALKIYSHFADIEEFKKLVEDYIPLENSMEIHYNDAEFTEIQTTVPQLIKNMKPDFKNIPLVSKYLNSNFIRPVQTSFNSVCHNSPAEMMVSILKEYFPTKGVSVKKVILQRISDLSSNDDKLDYFTKLWDGEKHSSVRSIILRTISKCFSRNPNRKILNIVKKCISEADTVIIEERPKLSVVPAEYLNEYVILLWDFINKIDRIRFVISFKKELIESLTAENVAVLSDEFCEMILKFYLFEDSDKLSVNNFVLYYLTSSPDSMNKKLSLILRLMKDRKANYASVTSFLSLLRTASIKKPKVYSGIIDGIVKEWPDIYGKVKLYDVYLNMLYIRGFCRLFKSSDQQVKDPEFAANLGKELRSIIDNVPDKFCFLELICTTIRSFFDMLVGLDENVTINHFLNDSYSQIEAIIAIKVLPNFFIDWHKSKQGGDTITSETSNEQCEILMRKLKSLNDDAVKIHLNLRFSNLI